MQYVYIDPINIYMNIYIQNINIYYIQILNRENAYVPGRRSGPSAWLAAGPAALQPCTPPSHSSPPCPSLPPLCWEQRLSQSHAHEGPRS